MLVRMLYFAEDTDASQSRLWTREMLHALVAARLSNRKLIVVSNREPYVHRQRGNQIEYVRPASGMASALNPIMTAAGGTWIAQGSDHASRGSDDAPERRMVPPENPAYLLRLLRLTGDQVDGFYHGLANGALWPLCHVAFTRPVFRERDWQHYREVNALFAQAVLEEAGNEPAIVFIQDYHFALLPRMLKKLAGDRLIVAHFWHIPWPNYEIFRAFPWREELLDGLLGNDLLGFQIRCHCQNFLEAVHRGIEAKVDQEQHEVQHCASNTKVRSFPISIDFASHEQHARSSEVEAAMRVWHAKLRLDGRLLGVGLERLDYTKGIPERLRAFERLLETHPNWRGRVVFAQVAVPSRSQLREYQSIEEEVDRLVAAINDRWGSDDWQPVILLKEYHDSTEMMALHRLARFCVVSSLHDGMNLVAKEFTASCVDGLGVLILSQFAGAQCELRDALSVNPFAVHELTAAMRTALEMSPMEQRRRMNNMRKQVAYNNVYRWAAKCLSAIVRCSSKENGASQSRSVESNTRLIA